MWTKGQRRSLQKRRIRPGAVGGYVADNDLTASVPVPGLVSFGGREGPHGPGETSPPDPRRWWETPSAHGPNNTPASDSRRLAARSVPLRGSEHPRRWTGGKTEGFWQKGTVFRRSSKCAARGASIGLSVAMNHYLRDNIAYCLSFCSC